ncbi:MAG: arginine deiminase [Bacilli bacterium]|nr:arginine deiminase [Bacilli bacterium]
MSQIKVNSEIGKLKVVLLHEPGEELHNLTPSKLDDLLFDDIPWLPLAKKEHQAFAKTFIDAGVKVVYLVDLMKEVLDLSNDIRNEFIEQFVKEADIHSNTLSELTIEYLKSIKDNKELILKTIAGIKKTDIPSYSVRTLTDHVEDYLFVADPMPNLYFQRDPFASIGDGVSLNKMYSVTRSRETIYAEYIFKYHPVYKKTPLYYSRYEDVNIEGGDIMVLNNHVLIVGVSQRTTSEAVERLAKNLFFNNETDFDTVLAFTIPQARTFMHLDTVFTQVDKNKFTIHKGCYEKLKIYRLTKDINFEGKLKVIELEQKLEDVLESYINMPATLIPCGGGDAISADREQWSDGSNTVALAPGEVIAYERNDITNEALMKNGIKVHIIPSSELSRGRGGPRCMCMPLVREEVEE